jgi:hypothetical protein
MSSRNLPVSFTLGLAASVGGMATGWMDSHTDEVSVTLVALLALRLSRRLPGQTGNAAGVALGANDRALDASAEATLCLCWDLPRRIPGYRARCPPILR